MCPLVDNEFVYSFSFTIVAKILNNYFNYMEFYSGNTHAILFSVTAMNI